MYRKGLTVGRIAVLCGAVRQTVSRHIRVQLAMHPGMETDHLANRPADKPRPAGLSWRAKIDALAAYLEVTGRYPTASNPSPVARGLAHWLSIQRRADRAGRMSEERRRLMSALPGWANNQRSKEAATRWQVRLGELQGFRGREGRWPRFRNAVDEDERVLGVWLHAQRQKASGGQLGAVEKHRLDATLPGWNTWVRK